MLKVKIFTLFILLAPLLPDNCFGQEEYQKAILKASMENETAQAFKEDLEKKVATSIAKLTGLQASTVVTTALTLSQLGQGKISTAPFKIRFSRGDFRIGPSFEYAFSGELKSGILLSYTF